MTNAIWTKHAPRRLFLVAAVLAAVVLMASGIVVLAGGGAKAYAAQQPAYAMMYEDDTLVFQRGNTPDVSHGKLVDSVADVENVKFANVDQIHGTSAWGFAFTDAKKVVFKDRVSPRCLDGWFVNMYELTSIEGIEKLDTSKATSAKRMFDFCSKLKSLDLSHFNTSKMTNMSLMFAGCGSLKKLDCSSFDTSRVTDMSMMFCDSYRLESVNVSSFNTKKVKNFTLMFLGAEGLKSLDLSSFTVAKDARLSLFHGNYQFTPIKSLKISPSFKAKLDLSFELNTTTTKGSRPELYVKSAKAKSTNAKAVSITKQGVATIKGVGKAKLKGSRGKTTTVTVVPSALTVSKVKPAKKAFTVSWKKQSAKSVDGYKVRYATKANMKGSKTKTVKGAKTTKLKVSKLKKGATYYVQVAAYKKVAGKTYVSAWSPAKTVKVK